MNSAARKKNLFYSDMSHSNPEDINIFLGEARITGFYSHERNVLTVYEMKLGSPPLVHQKYKPCADLLPISL
jgi:hypothetical protein